MTLIYVDGSPFARIARILIQEWALPIETREVAFPLPPEIDALSPMGQVPLLLRAHAAPLFPTLNILPHLWTQALDTAPFPLTPAAQTQASIALAAGDALCQAAYQMWAGHADQETTPLGFDPARRNQERFTRTMAWLAGDTDLTDLSVLIMAVFAYWSKDRGLGEVELPATAKDRVEACWQRKSFQSTVPRKHENTNVFS